MRKATLDDVMNCICSQFRLTLRLKSRSRHWMSELAFWSFFLSQVRNCSDTNVFNVITFIASLLRGTAQGNMTSQRERTVAEMTHAQPWLPSPTADPHSRDCYMNTSYSMHNTQLRLPVNDNDVITSVATIGTFEAVVFF